MPLYILGHPNLMCLIASQKGPKTIPDPMTLKKLCRREEHISDKVITVS